MHTKEATAHSNVSSSIIRKLFSITFLCLIIHGSVSAQLKTISGSVKDSSDAPLPGITVSVKNSKTTVITDNSGNFTISVNSNSKVLRFTSIGYEMEEAAINADNTINVHLRSIVKQLGEVVVIGYGTSSKRDVTGSITSLKSEDFNQGVITTPAELL